MTTLVADVGGTNSRLALASDQGLDAASIQRFSNADYPSFYAIVQEYLATNAVDGIKTCCVAMAGPVTAQKAKMTNLDWEISDIGLKRAARADRAILMNDLSALGYSVAYLPASGLHIIKPATSDEFQNGQSLIAGVGTGFNVCPLTATGPGSVTCLEAELGHTSLPNTVTDLLHDHPKLDAARFSTVEDCFSGRGLSAIHAMLSQSNPIAAGQIVARHSADSDPAATAALELFADLLGVLAREMALQYLPMNGLYFAGSVARGVFLSGLQDRFIKSFANHRQFKTQLDQIPVSLILDDAAALIGCVEAAKLQMT